jgi:hypothetical protein
MASCGMSTVPTRVIRDSVLPWVPTRAGLPRTIDTGIFRPALFVHPDGKRALVWGVGPDGQLTPNRVVRVESGASVAASRTLTPPVGAKPASRCRPTRDLWPLSGGTGR